MSDWYVTELTEDDERWSVLREHLERVRMRHHALMDHGAKPDGYYLAAITGRMICGHIAIQRQPVRVPASHLTEALQLTAPDGSSLYETFVQTFAVEEDFRRRGIGRALQSAALEKTRSLGCYQMRSWSSADRQANYALKINMGFAVHPALYPMPGGQPLSGVYFVMRV